jgi:hypothetical protein
MVLFHIVMAKFPGNMHTYIWCPYYLPSSMKFCSVVSEELHWQTASVVNFEVQRGITPTKFRRSKFPGNMHNYIWCPYYLPSFMKFCSVVSEELRWQTVWRTDRQTDRRTGQKQCLPTKVGGDIIRRYTTRSPQFNKFNEKNPSKLNENSIWLPHLQNVGIHAPFRPLIEIKYTTNLYGPSIIH